MTLGQWYEKDLGSGSDVYQMLGEINRAWSAYVPGGDVSYFTVITPSGDVVLFFQPPAEIALRFRASACDEPTVPESARIHHTVEPWG